MRHFVFHYIIFVFLTYDSQSAFRKLDTRLLFNVLDIDLKEVGNTLFLHGYAVKGIGGFHSSSSVGNDDKLGVLAVSAKVLTESCDVDVVKCRLYLIEDVEGCGIYLEDGEFARLTPDSLTVFAESGEEIEKEIGFVK